VAGQEEGEQNEQQGKQADNCWLWAKGLTKGWRFSCIEPVKYGIVEKKVNIYCTYVPIYVPYSTYNCTLLHQ
jgi:hypothetical protein